MTLASRLTRALLGRGYVWLNRVRDGISALLRAALRANPRLADEFGPLEPEGARLLLDASVPTPEARLDEIPSETSAAERRFLFTFFAGLWSGRGNVVEIGPYFGGSTRAIALGMCANPGRGADAKLFTYDRFHAYREPRELIRQLAVLFETGTLDADVKDDVRKSGSFGAVFDALHLPYRYGELIERRAEPLPDTPAERGGGEVLSLEEVERSEAFFVDGCKSWYATKHFAREAASIASPGAWFLFQDYGWYTCFWLPSLVHSLGDLLALRFQVEGTYAFQLVGPLTGAEVDQRFPDVPDQVDFDLIFSDLARDAVIRGDVRGSVMSQLQHAAALTYVGDVDTARRLIRKARRRHRFSGFRSLIDAAAVAPTYRPGGKKIYLDSPSPIA
jgi:hypothetical protein